MIRKFLIFFLVFSYPVTIFSEGIEFPPEAELLKNCNKESSSRCSELGLSKLYQKKNKEALKYFKQACSIENDCLSLANFYEDNGKFKEAKEILTKSCENDVAYCYKLAKFEKKHGNQEAYLFHLKRACSKRFLESSCRNMNLESQSSIEKTTTLEEELAQKMKIRNASCLKNDGPSCYELATVLNEMESKVKSKDKNDFKKVLNDIGINESSSFYFKKACQLKQKHACNK